MLAALRAAGKLSILHARMMRALLTPPVILRSTKCDTLQHLSQWNEEPYRPARAFSGDQNACLAKKPSRKWRRTE
jgi:hypothetical protein